MFSAKAYSEFQFQNELLSLKCPEVSVIFVQVLEHSSTISHKIAKKRKTKHSKLQKFEHPLSLTNKGIHIAIMLYSHIHIILSQNTLLSTPDAKSRHSGHPNIYLPSIHESDQGRVMGNCLMSPHNFFPSIYSHQWVLIEHATLRHTEQHFIQEDVCVSPIPILEYTVFLLDWHFVLVAYYQPI